MTLKPRNEEYWDLFVKFTDGTYHSTSHESMEAAKALLEIIRRHGIKEASIYHEWAFVDPERKNAKLLHSIRVYHEPMVNP